MLNTALKYFLEVVNTGSVTVAAQKLHVAPSAISRMIKKLEEEHETQLFGRHARGMHLTEAGELLASYARRTHLESERTVADIRDLRRVGPKLLKISANQAFGRELLPRVMGEFRRTNPAVRFQLNVLQSAEINRRIRKGDDDIGLSYNLSPPEGVRIQYARRMPVFAMMAPHHPLASSKALSMAQIGQYPVALMGPGSTIRFSIDLCCMHEKIELNVALVSNNQGAIQNFCRDWNAIGFSGDLTVLDSIERGELIAVPMTNDELHQRNFHIQTLEGRELPASAERYIQAIIQHVERLYERQDLPAAL